LNFAARDTSTQRVARHAAPPSPQMRELLLQQEQILVELTDPGERPHAATVLGLFRPRPHSQRREDFLNT
jgi:hypothetical protein